MFSTTDWEGILLLGDSVKAKDPMKVGRFGLGFKSVFHITGMSTFQLLNCYSAFVMHSQNGHPPHAKSFSISMYEFQFRQHISGTGGLFLSNLVALNRMLVIADVTKLGALEARCLWMDRLIEFGVLRAVLVIAPTSMRDDMI